MKVDFIKELSIGANLAEEKEENSKLIDSVLNNFFSSLRDFIGLDFDIYTSEEFFDTKQNSAISHIALAVSALSNNPNKKTGFINWLLDNPATNQRIFILAIKEGKQGFPIQIKINDNTTVCETESDINEALKLLASDSEFHLKLKKLRQNK